MDTYVRTPLQVSPTCLDICVLGVLKYVSSVFFSDICVLGVLTYVSSVFFSDVCVLGVLKYVS